jgi:hypothetical protein
MHQLSQQNCPTLQKLKVNTAPFEHKSRPQITGSSHFMVSNWRATQASPLTCILKLLTNVLLECLRHLYFVSLLLLHSGSWTSKRRQIEVVLEYQEPVGDIWTESKHKIPLSTPHVLAV